MKARIKATGEIIEVRHGKAVAGNNVYLSDNIMYQQEELEPAEPDWQQVLIQASIAAMNIVKGAYNVHNDMERLVHHSVKLADALITELKKGGQDETAK